ncbi:MAG: hypothetical protein V3W19_01410 [Desulfatiglandales bacterium]
MNVYSGNADKVIVYHPLDAEDSPSVGPPAYTIKGGASFSPTAQFGAALSAPSTGDSLDSDSGISGSDSSDTAKTLAHFHWRTPIIGGTDQTHVILGNSGLTTYQFCTHYIPSTNRLICHWRRSVLFSAFGDVMEPQALSASGFLTANTFHKMLFYVDGNSATQGKIFVDGIDRTSNVVATFIGSTAVIPTPFPRIGNFISPGSFPANFVDDLVIIQGSFLSDAVVASLVVLYDNVRGFGFKPVILSVEKDPNFPETKILIRGSGFGPDASVLLNGILAVNKTIFGDDAISVTVPLGVTGLTSIIAVTNVLANVTVTEDALVIPIDTILRKNLWTENGLSNRVIGPTDNITPEMNIRAGDPLPVFNPRVRHTVWTQTSP